MPPMPWLSRTPQRVRRAVKTALHPVRKVHFPTPSTSAATPAATSSPGNSLKRQSSTKSPASSTHTGMNSSRRIRASSPPSTYRNNKYMTYQRRPDIPDWLRKAGFGAWATIGIVIVTGLIVYAVARVPDAFIAVFVALLFTAILNPIVNFLHRWIPRWLAVTITLIGAVAFLVFLVFFVIASAVTQWPNLSANFNDGLNKIIALLNSLPFDIKLTANDITNWFNQTVTNVQAYVTENWQKIAGDLWSNVSTVAIVLTIIFLALFLSVFFLQSGSHMWKWFLNLVPERRRLTVHRAASAGWNTFSGYARGTVFIAAADAVAATILLLILGIPVAPALGVLVFIGGFIPIIGAPAAMIVAMVVAFATSGVFKALLVGVGIAVIGQLEGNILQPLIMGKQVSLHPVVVGLGVAVGTMIAGLLGAVIAVPLIAVVWAVFSELYVPDPPIGDFRELEKK